MYINCIMCLIMIYSIELKFEFIIFRYEGFSKCGSTICHRGLLRHSCLSIMLTNDLNMYADNYVELMSDNCSELIMILRPQLDWPWKPNANPKRESGHTEAVRKQCWVWRKIIYRFPKIYFIFICLEEKINSYSVYIS